MRWGKRFGYNESHSTECYNPNSAVLETHKRLCHSIPKRPFCIAARAASAHDLLVRAIHLGSHYGETLLRSAGLDKHGSEILPTVGVVGHVVEEQHVHRVEEQTEESDLAEVSTLPSRNPQSAGVGVHHNAHGQFDGPIGIDALALLLLCAGSEVVGHGGTSAFEQRGEVALILCHQRLVEGLRTTGPAHQRHHVLALLPRFAHHALHLLIAEMDRGKGEEQRVEEGWSYLFVVVEHRPLHVFRLTPLFDESLRTVDDTRGEGIEEGSHQGCQKFMFVSIHLLCYFRFCENYLYGNQLIKIFRTR